MVICEDINVKDQRLLDGLIPVIKIMAQAESSNDSDLTIDFSNTKFISPVFALSLIVYLSSCHKKVSMVNTNDYLDTIGIINQGVRTDLLRKTQFIALMEKYSNRTYIPIIAFPSGTNTDEKEAISTVVENIIIRQSNIERNIAQGIKYMVDEAIDNITEHSESPFGYIFAQAYPKKGFLDICIADKGITLKGSYEKLVDNEISSDLEAIKAANRGISSKNLPEAENRGYGIWTSKRMIVEGLNGQYLMISGGNIYHKGPAVDRFYSMPDGLRWNGTLVALRIPYKLSTQFNYVNYIDLI